jgi:hypothetical protein
MKKMILEKIIWIIKVWHVFVSGLDSFAVASSVSAILSFIALAVNNFVIATLLTIIGYVFFLAGIVSQKNIVQRKDRKKS